MWKKAIYYFFSVKLYAAVLFYAVIFSCCQYLIVQQVFEDLLRSTLLFLLHREKAQPVLQNGMDHKCIPLQVSHVQPVLEWSSSSLRFILESWKKDDQLIRRLTGICSSCFSSSWAISFSLAWYTSNCFSSSSILLFRIAICFS